MHKELPLLFVPGLACNRTMWAGQIGALSDLTSCWVAPLPAYDDLRAIATDILRDAPAQFALAGSSMGGYLCFEILRLAPERVAKLALIGTTADPELPDTTERRWRMIRNSEKRGYLTMWREFIPRFVHPSRSEDPVLIEALMKQAFEIGHYAFRQHQIAMMKRRGYLDLLHTIDCPTTILVGDGDILTPIDTHETMARSIPDSRLTVFSESGHLLSIERPAETAAALRDWLLADTFKAAA
jgi:pimeloyl-ACP methyl ester carboxylesterase